MIIQTLIFSLVLSSLTLSKNSKASKDFGDDDELPSDLSELNSLSRFDFLERRLESLFEDVIRIKEIVSHLDSASIQNGDRSISNSLFAAISKHDEQQGHSRELRRSTRAPIGPVIPPGARNRRNSEGVELARGPPGRNGLDGVPGLDGAPGLDGIPGVDGRNGKDGTNGRDGLKGKDGLPGERGPMGPVGPPGEVGRRGKPGVQGKPGPPGPAGVCAYQAKYDCSLLAGANYSWTGDPANVTNRLVHSTQALLMAPTMLGQSRTGDANEERQVTVNEGDNIQLSCEASGLPKPEYLWQRAEQGSTILMDITSDLQLTGFPGSQLPLFNVDRLHSGDYVCEASNGISPSAIKRVDLNVNYAPTVRIYPSPAFYQVELGSSLLVECIVDANPSPFTYWVHEEQPIMSVEPQKTPFPSLKGAPLVREVSSLKKVLDDREDPELMRGSRLEVSNDVGLKDGENKESSGQEAMADVKRTIQEVTKRNKYIITESTGQLSTGAFYSVLSLNITNIEPADLGSYKCISKNLLAQTVGPFSIIAPGTAGNSLVVSAGFTVKPYGSTSSNTDNLMIERPILIHERLDFTLGWPRYLLERNANYSTFGIGHRPKLSLNAKRIKPESFATNSSGLPGTNSAIAGLPQIKSLIDHLLTETKPLEQQNKTKFTVADSVGRNGMGPKTGSGDKVDVSDQERSSDDPKEMCTIQKFDSSRSTRRPGSDIQLLDQVGKPVYVGSMPESSLNWWSMDSGTKPATGEQFINATLIGPHYYSTSPSHEDKLFEYNSLEELLQQNQQIVPESHDSEPKHSFSRRSHQMKHSFIKGNSHLVYNSLFFYVTREKSSSKAENNEGTGRLRDLVIVMMNLTSGEHRYLKLDDRVLRDIESQPLDLRPDYQLNNRVELASDENGVWLILPTIERKLVSRSWSGETNFSSPDSSMNQHTEPKMRRLHVLKLDWSPPDSNNIVGQSHEVRNSRDSGIGTLIISHHVSMRLDWRLIGQMFIIDGVLYGIKDRHLYSSKLQFAYDLYRCRLLSADYLNEVHRTFTNHFGNTQMIKYNPREPKRLLTIDNGNLLWCPIKLIKTNPQDIWPQVELVSSIN